MWTSGGFFHCVQCDEVCSLVLVWSIEKWNIRRGWKLLMLLPRLLLQRPPGGGKPLVENKFAR